MATIRDVAREAGVSIATVSRFFHGGANILPETKERVQQAIDRLDYHPNRLAQQFRTQATHNVLVVVPELGNAFYSDIIAGIESVANAHSYSVFIMDSHGSSAKEARSLELLSQKMVDGIITFSASLPQEEIERVAAQFPIVVACRYFDTQTLPNVTIDNAKATKDMVNYMLNLGHKRICYLAGPSDILLYRDRVNGYTAALKERGIPLDENLILHCAPSIQGGYDVINAAINDSRLHFTAVVASGDSMAIGAMRALQSHGYQVPGDISVAGFDDIELSALISPTLTTVRQPKRQIGVRSMEKLLEVIAGNTPAVNREILPYELVIRESSGNFVGSK